MFASAGKELKFHPWPREKNSLDETYKADNPSNIIGLSWSKDNKFVIYLQDGGKPEILSLKEINNIKSAHVITVIENATCVSFQKKSKKIVAVGTSSSTVVLYNTRDKCIEKLFNVPANVTNLDFSADDTCIAVACEDGTITMLNIVDENQSCSYNVDCMPCVLQCHSSQREVFAVGTNNGTLFKFDISKEEAIYKSKCHVSKITGIAFSVMNDLIITSGDDCKFCTHDPKADRCVFKTYLPYPLTAMDITPDGAHLAVGTDEGSIFIFEMKKLSSPMLRWQPHNASITLIKFGHRRDTGGMCERVSSLESCTTTDSTIRVNKMPILAPELLRLDNEFKLLYNKFLNKSDQETMIALREFLLADYRKQVRQLQMQTVVNLGVLLDFIQKEFKKLNGVVLDQWHLIDSVCGNTEHVDGDFARLAIEQRDVKEVVRRVQREEGDEGPFIIE